MGKFNRRDFLKLLGLSPIFLAQWSQFNKLTVDSSKLSLMEGYLDKRSVLNHSNSNLPNILIVVFDALSARNMSLYGYRRHTTPNLERLAEKAIVFHQHHAGGNFTTPGTSSLLMGTYPWSHRGFNPQGVVKDSYIEKSIFHLFQSSYSTFAYSHNPLVNTLFHQLRNSIDQWARLSELCMAAYSYADEYFKDDYISAYQGEELLLRKFKSPSSSFFISRFDRLKRYFKRISLNREYKDLFPRGVPNFGFIFFTIERVLEWMKTQFEEQPKPFLGYVHLLPPHDPYLTRREFVDCFADGWRPSGKPEHFFSEGRSEEALMLSRRLYDESIAYIDAEFGRLYDSMEQIGILDHTCVVFTSDHGEMFERGIWAHVTPTLYEPIIHIPLLMWTPGQDRRKDVFIPTSCVDVLPTLLHLTGQAIPDWCEGQVLPTYRDQPVDVERSIFTVEAKENSMRAPLERATVSLVKGRYKLIHYFGYEGYENEYEFYDLKDDPEELVDLYPFLTPTASALKDEMAKKLAEVDRPYR